MCQRGFSLLELLVTLFVVVLVTSLVTLNITTGGRDIELDADVRGLADTASYALDEAQMLGVSYGLQVMRFDEDGELRHGYRWRELLPQGWREPTSGKEVFAAVQFDPGIELRLELEDIAVEEFALASEADNKDPQVLLYASGEVTEGALEIIERDSGELLWRVEWDLLGRFTLLRRGQEDLFDEQGE